MEQADAIGCRMGRIALDSNWNCAYCPLSQILPILVQHAPAGGQRISLARDGPDAEIVRGANIRVCPFGNGKQECLPTGTVRANSRRGRGTKMVLHLHGWNRRLVGLSTCLFLCTSVGCSTTKEDRKPLTNEVGANNVGPGGPASPLAPISNTNQGTTVARNPGPTTGQFNTSPPVMPPMPGPNRFMTGPSTSTPNINMNQANFGATSAPSNQTAPISNIGIQQVVPLQQPVGGQQMQLPQIPQANAPQPSSPVPPAPQASQNQSQMPGVQMPLEQSQPVQQPAVAQNGQSLSPPTIQQPSVPPYNPAPIPVQPASQFQGSTSPPAQPPAVPIYNEAPKVIQFQGSSQFPQASPPAAAPTIQMNQFAPASPSTQLTAPAVIQPTNLSSPMQPAAAPLPAPPPYVPTPPLQPIQPGAPIQLQQPPNIPAGQTPPNPAPQGPNLSDNGAAQRLSETMSKLDPGNSSMAPTVKVVASGPLRNAQMESTNPAAEPIEGAPIYPGDPR